MDNRGFNTGDTVVLVSNFFQPFSRTVKLGVKAFLKKVGTSNDRYKYNDYELENAFHLLSPKDKLCFASHFYSSEFVTTRMVLIEKHIKEFEL